MEGHEALLDVRAGAHLWVLPIRTRTDPCVPFEEGLFLGVGFGVADGGDLLARDALGDQL